MLVVPARQAEGLIVCLFLWLCRKLRRRTSALVAVWQILLVDLGGLFLWVLSSRRRRQVGDVIGPSREEPFEVEREQAIFKVGAIEQGRF